MALATPARAVPDSSSATVMGPAATVTGRVNDAARSARAARVWNARNQPSARSAGTAGGRAGGGGGGVAAPAGADPERRRGAPRRPQPRRGGREVRAGSGAPAVEE